jgi:hypothetical protein
MPVQYYYAKIVWLPQLTDTVYRTMRYGFPHFLLRKTVKAIKFLCFWLLQ